MIVLMANGDDNSYITFKDNDRIRQDYLKEKKREFLRIRDRELQSSMFRFISLVPHVHECRPKWQLNIVYKEMSKILYEAPYPNNNPSPTDQNCSPGRRHCTPDSYDLCQADFKYIFDGPNNSLVVRIDGHRYDHWLISPKREVTFDHNKITVKKNTEQILKENDRSNGFLYIGYREGINTRFEPTPGEPVTGHVIRLYGKGVVDYPECLIITTQTPLDHFGYIPLKSKPYADSIEVKIDGKTILQSSTNGWTLLKDAKGNPKYFKNKNMKIQDPSQTENNIHLEDHPPLYKTGYMLKVHGDAIFTNNSKIQVIYFPSS